MYIDNVAIDGGRRLRESEADCMLLVNIHCIWRLRPGHL